MIPVPVLEAVSCHVNMVATDVAEPYVNTVVSAFGKVSASVVVGAVRLDQAVDDPPDPQSDPVPVTTPAVLTWRH